MKLDESSSHMLVSLSSRGITHLQMGVHSLPWSIASQERQTKTVRIYHISNLLRIQGVSQRLGHDTVSVYQVLVLPTLRFRVGTIRKSYSITSRELNYLENSYSTYNLIRICFSLIRTSVPVKKILPSYQEVIVANGESFTLHPGTTVLGMSMEKFGSEKYLIQLSGKSSLARLGLIVHNTAGLINPGHYLNITFELANMNSVPIVLRPGMEIAQLLFAMMSSPPERDYRKTGRYGEGESNLTSYIHKD